MPSPYSVLGAGGWPCDGADVVAGRHLGDGVAGPAQDGHAAVELLDRARPDVTPVRLWTRTPAPSPEPLVPKMRWPLRLKVMLLAPMMIPLLGQGPTLFVNVVFWVMVWPQPG